MKYVNPIVLSDTTAASRTSSAIDASQIYQASFQAIFEKTDVTGTVKIQMSNDPSTGGPQQASFVPTNWSDVPSATATITAGVVAPIILSVVAARWLRVVFTKTGGATGTVIVQMFVVSA